MFAKLKAAWANLTSGHATADRAAPTVAPIEYKGYRIQPAPYVANGQYQTCGVIEKDTPDGMKQHRFIRADTYSTRDDAIEFTISKAKQIIDMQGDRMFANP